MAKKKPVRVNLSTPTADIVATMREEMPKAQYFFPLIQKIQMTPIDYYDPYNMMGYDPYKGMNDEERLKACLRHMAAMGIALLLALTVCILLGSCTTTKYVTVPEVHEHWHHSTDTIHMTDSIIDRQTTTIREVDSATMARYGIQMKDMQRAWLIETNRLQRELSELRQTHNDTIHERDSIPYPVEVVKEVPAQPSWWQRFLMFVGGITSSLLIIVAVWWFVKKRIV